MPYKPKICVVCGKEHVPKVGSQKTCGSECSKIIKKEYYKEYMKEYNQRPEVIEKRREYRKGYTKRLYVKEKRNKYLKKPEVKKRRNELALIKCAKKGQAMIENSIYIFEAGIIIGFLYEWFKEKYPSFTWEIYNEPKWKQKSLELVEKANWKCEICGDYGDQVHHKRNFYNHPQIALKDSNLQVLCKFHHERITLKNKERFEGKTVTSRETHLRSIARGLK